MKRIYLLISLLTPTVGLAEGEIDIANAFLEKFKQLSDKEKVQAISHKRLLDSPKTSAAQITAAIESRPEKFTELCRLIEPLVPKIIDHCASQLSCEIGLFLAAFKNKSLEEQRTFILSAHAGEFIFYPYTQEGIEYLEENLTQESDQEHLYTAIRLLQIFPYAETPEVPPSPIMPRNQPRSTKKSHSMPKLPSVKKVLGLS